MEVHISFRQKGFQAKEPGAATTRAPGFFIPLARQPDQQPSGRMMVRETCTQRAGLRPCHRHHALRITFSTRMPAPSDPPPRLTSKQRAHLRSLAHDLDPVVRVGKDGLSDAVVDAAEEAFNTRELLKARVLDNAMEGARDVAHALAERLDDVQVVQVIGHVAILYRPDPDAPQIELPG